MQWLLFLSLINFSYSCGYRKAFEEYANIITERYPQISIEGANYDPPGLNFLLSKLILAAKMIFILIIVSQYDIWGQLGQAVPRWFTWCVENKIYACMMVFFVGNMLEAQVIWTHIPSECFVFAVSFGLCTPLNRHVIKMVNKCEYFNHFGFLFFVILFLAGVIGCLRN